MITLMVTHKGGVFVGIIVALASLLIIYLAYLIKYKKKVELIAGYDEKSIKDKDGLANWIGGTLLKTGILSFFFGVFAFIMPQHTNLFMLAYGITVMAGSVIATTGGNKFKV